MSNQTILIKPAIRRKLNGYRCSHRNKWILLHEKVLSLQALMLLEFYVDIFDFDSKHETFGTFTVDFSAFSTIFNCSLSTIRNWHRELVGGGYVEPTDTRNVYKLINALRYIVPGHWKGQASYYSEFEKNQPVTEIVQLMKQNVQPVTAEPTLSPRLPRPIALVSSKDESSDYVGLPKDDIKWIERQFERSGKNG
jgi:hypothetical protein